MKTSKLVKMIGILGISAMTFIPLKYGIDFASKEIDYFNSVNKITKMDVYKALQEGKYGLHPIKNPLIKSKYDTTEKEEKKYDK